MAERAANGGRLDGAAIFAVMMVAAVFAVALGLTYPLLSFILESQEHSAFMIGLNTAMMPVGIIVASPFVQTAFRRVGGPRLVIVCALTIGASILLTGAYQNIWFWFFTRFFIGVAEAGLFVVSETWVNQLAPPDKRGRVLGFYTSAMALGFAAGPLILRVTGTDGMTPFLIGGAIMAISASLLWTLRNRLPEVIDLETASMRAFLPLAPYLLALVCTVAAFDQGVLSLYPVYGLQLSPSPETVVLQLDVQFGLWRIQESVTAWDAILYALAVLIIGNIVFQVPIGRLADAWSRRGTMALRCETPVSAAVPLRSVGAPPSLVSALFFAGG